jgi:hypothetical protein
MKSSLARERYRPPYSVVWPITSIDKDGNAMWCLAEVVVEDNQYEIHWHIPGRNKSFAVRIMKTCACLVKEAFEQLFVESIWWKRVNFPITEDVQ